MPAVDWRSDPPNTQSGDFLAIPFTADDLDWLRAELGADVGAALTRAGVRGKPGDRFEFTRTEGGFCPVLLLGVEGFDDADNLRTAAFEAARAARSAGAQRLVFDVRRTLARSDRASARLIAMGLELAEYRFDRFLTPDDPPKRLEAATVVCTSFDDGESDVGARDGKIVADAIARARDLGNGPAETVTPSALAQTAEDLAAELREDGHDVRCTILSRQECEDRNMGLYLAVARGSEQPPKFVHLHYTPKAESKGRVCLVGKGVTFDSGGYSLKPSDAMLGMKLDMAGAAAVVGSMAAIARLELPYEVHSITAATENMISGKAYRLGDVFRASNGKTVEINNTDAEGRLTLADALVYAGALEPDLIIDFATLTGACIIALGPHIAGVMTRDDALADGWIAAGRRTGDQHWRLPLPKPLMKMLDSKIADLRNTGERAGGTLTAGLFLEQFVGDHRWMHVDIAGPAIVNKPFGVHDEGSSGFPVATIVEFLSGDLPR